MHLSTSLFLFGTLFLPTAQAVEFTPLELSFPHLQELRRAEYELIAQTVKFSYPEHSFSVPVDHFHNESRYEPHSNDHFDIRYWFDASHYQEGGPVFLIAAGETDATERFPFLSQGIVTQLAKAYHGIGVILEHRYYGESYPFASLTTENIRFLSTEQALADYVHFANNIVFPGLEHVNLTARDTPWIAYGGSYAGAFVAFLRKLYPDTFFAAVSSSGVTEAIEDYWQYYEPVHQFAPTNCVWAMETFLNIVDRILIDHADDDNLKSQLKAAFGASDEFDDEFFVSFLSYGLDSFQSRNWDSAIGSLAFMHHCNNLTSPTLLYPHSPDQVDLIKSFISTAKYDASNSTILTGMLNYVGYLKAMVFSKIPTDTINGERKSTSSEVSASPQPLGRSSDVSWKYQVCTEWGYFTPGSTVPKGRLPLLSRLLTVSGLSWFCKEDYGFTTRPDTDRINKHGGFNFSYPRVAIIDGLADPWRPATPHADGTQPRISTDKEPFILVDVPAADVWDGIRGAVHHWDQNGLSDKELMEGKRPPKTIIDLHKEIIRFVGVWLKQSKNTEYSPASVVYGQGGPAQLVLGEN